jgi:hypothetical protein
LHAPTTTEGDPSGPAIEQPEDEGGSSMRYDEKDSGCQHQLASAPRMARPSTRPTPPSSGTPDWSEPTLALLRALPPTERCFVEWYATGLNAAEAFRKATGKDSTAARQLASRMRSRPRVKAAIDAALSDRNLGPRMDREYLLGHLYVAIERLRGRDNPRAGLGIARLVKLVAQLQGELPRGRSAGPHRPVGPGPGTAKLVDLRRELDGMLAESRTPPSPASRFEGTVAEVLKEVERRASQGHPRPAPPVRPSPDMVVAPVAPDPTSARTPDPGPPPPPVDNHVHRDAAPARPDGPQEPPASAWLVPARYGAGGYGHR